MNPLTVWVYERDAIRKKREWGQPPPWTNDEILATYRFTNVRRRHDRVSRWLRNNVLLESNVKLGTSFITFSAFCRWCNWPPTIAEIQHYGLWPRKRIDWIKIAAVLEQRAARREKVWTGAYMIKAAVEWRGKPKPQFVVREVIRNGVQPIAQKLREVALRKQSRRAVWELLVSRKYWGGFMAGQVVDDWGWTSLLFNAKDTYTWAPQGPGSLRGFNRMLGLPLSTRHDEVAWCNQLVRWREEIIVDLGPEFRDLTLMDVQNALCELDKYLRAKNGEGRPRSMYRTETAYTV